MYVCMCEVHIESEQVVSVQLMQAFFPLMFAAKSKLYIYIG